MTPFADLTHEEYKTMLGLKFNPRKNCQEKKHPQVILIFMVSIFKLKTNYNFLRKTVTKVSGTFLILWIGGLEELLHQ